VRRATCSFLLFWFPSLLPGFGPLANLQVSVCTALRPSGISRRSREWRDRQEEFEKEVGDHFQAGKLKNKETVVEGIDQAVGAFIGLFEGKNVGKMVVESAWSLTGSGCRKKRR
jgi:hypothetical protein